VLPDLRKFEAPTSNKIAMRQWIFTVERPRRVARELFQARPGENLPVE
jgi:hypothetical protein